MTSEGGAGLLHDLRAFSPEPSRLERYRFPVDGETSIGYEVYKQHDGAFGLNHPPLSQQYLCAFL